MFFWLREGFRLASLPHSPDIWRIREIAVTCSAQSVLANNSCSSFNVAEGPLAASQTSFLVFSSILEGRPALSNVTVVLYFLHLLMTVLTLFHGIPNNLETFLYLPLTLFSSLWCVSFSSFSWVLCRDIYVFCFHVKQCTSRGAWQFSEAILTKYKSNQVKQWDPIDAL